MSCNDVKGERGVDRIHAPRCGFRSSPAGRTISARGFHPLDSIAPPLSSRPAGRTKSSPLTPPDLLLTCSVRRRCLENARRTGGRSAFIRTPCRKAGAAAEPPSRYPRRPRAPTTFTFSSEIASAALIGRWCENPFSHPAPRDSIPRLRLSASATPGQGPAVCSPAAQALGYGRPADPPAPNRGDRVRSARPCLRQTWSCRVCPRPTPPEETASGRPACLRSALVHWAIKVSLRFGRGTMLLRVDAGSVWGALAMTTGMATRMGTSWHDVKPACVGVARLMVKEATAIHRQSLGEEGVLPWGRSSRGKPDPLCSPNA